MNTGEKVRAIRDLPYMGGQVPEDKIERGELVTIARHEWKTLKEGAVDRIFLEEHADRYGPWPASDFIPNGMLWCPDCENAVSVLYHARSVEVEWNGGEWAEKEVLSSTFGCSICNADIDERDMETFGVPAEGTKCYDCRGYENDCLECATGLLGADIAKAQELLKRHDLHAEIKVGDKTAQMLAQRAAERACIKVGDSFTSEALLEKMGLTIVAMEQQPDLVVLENDKMLVIGEGAGNDNWTVTHVCSRRGC